MIRQSMRASEKVNSWPIPLRYFWTQLWGYCDDHGRGRRDARLILADTFPMDEEVTLEMVERWMVALEKSGVIATYKVNGKSYFECVNWDEHQEPPYYKKTDIPDKSGIVPIAQKRSAKFQKVPEKFSRIEGGIEVEEKGKEPPRKCPEHAGTRFAPLCGNCKEARLEHEQWVKDHPPATKSGIITPPTCKHDYPTGACPHCESEAAA